jgi:hypothetical protein
MPTGLINVHVDGDHLVNMACVSFSIRRLPTNLISINDSLSEIVITMVFVKD